MLQRPVAIKALRGETADRGRFAAEVRLLASLTHPNLVRVWDAVVQPDLAVVVMEFIDGPSLAELLRLGPLSAERTERLAVELAACLDYLHDHGVVHRDVKPGNILIGSDGRARLADFGIARLVDETRVTAPGEAIGTFRYMAPEQLDGTSVGPPADIYAFGLVLLEALTGHPGFAGTATEAVAARLARDPEIPLDLDPSWAGLIRDLTARSPAARPTARELHRRLMALRVASGGAWPAAPGTTAQGPPTLAGGGDPPTVAALPFVPPDGRGPEPTQALVWPAAVEPSTEPGPVVAATVGGAAAVATTAPRRRRWAPRSAWIALVAVLATAAAAGGVLLALRHDHQTANEPATTTSLPAATTTLPPTTQTTVTSPRAPATPSTRATTPTTGTATTLSPICAALVAQRRALDAQQRLIDANPNLSAKQKAAFKRALDTQRKALTHAGCP